MIYYSICVAEPFYQWNQIAEPLVVTQSVFLLFVVSLFTLEENGKELVGYEFVVHLLKSEIKLEFILHQI